MNQTLLTSIYSSEYPIIRTTINRIIPGLYEPIFANNTYLTVRYRSFIIETELKKNKGKKDIIIKINPVLLRSVDSYQHYIVWEERKTELSELANKIQEYISKKKLREDFMKLLKSNVNNSNIPKHEFSERKHKNERNTIILTPYLDIINLLTRDDGVFNQYINLIETYVKDGKKFYRYNVQFDEYIQSNIFLYSTYNGKLYYPDYIDFVFKDKKLNLFVSSKDPGREIPREDYPKILLDILAMYIEHYIKANIKFFTNTIRLSLLDDIKPIFERMHTYPNNKMKPRFHVFYNMLIENFHNINLITIDKIFTSIEACLEIRKK